MKTMLNIALPKGRLGERVYKMFAEAGFPCPAVLENSRKLIFENLVATLRVRRWSSLKPFFAATAIRQMPV